LSAVGRTHDHVDVFWIGSDGAVGSTWRDSAPGCGWGDHQPFTAAGPRPVPLPIGPHHKC
jgi:hypothetical protein